MTIPKLIKPLPWICYSLHGLTTLHMRYSGGVQHWHHLLLDLVGRVSSRANISFHVQLAVADNHHGPRFGAAWHRCVCGEVRMDFCHAHLQKLDGRMGCIYCSESGKLLTVITCLCFQLAGSAADHHRAVRIPLGEREGNARAAQANQRGGERKRERGG